MRSRSNHQYVDRDRVLPEGDRAEVRMDPQISRIDADEDRRDEKDERDLKDEREEKEEGTPSPLAPLPQERGKRPGTMMEAGVNLASLAMSGYWTCKRCDHVQVTRERVVVAGKWEPGNEEEVARVEQELAARGGPRDGEIVDGLCERCGRRVLKWHAPI